MSAQNYPATNAPHGPGCLPLNDDAKQPIKLLERRYRAVKETFEMMTVFATPSPKSATAMVEDAEQLLDAAKKMLVAITPKEVETGFNANPPRRI